MSTNDRMRSLVLERRSKVATERLERYRRMLEIRAVEDCIQRLFLDGLVDGTTHTCQGQEAVAVGVAAALRPTDTVACTYRGHGHALALGLDPETLIAEILGRVGGCMGGLGGSMHLSNPDIGLLPTFAIVGAGVPVAAGVALSAQVRGTDQIGVGVCGDGAANIGAFHEGLNLAAIWRLPVVFVIENNHYGEYSRIDKTTPIANLADRADSYGIPGVVVDGQDVDAVEQAMGEAVDRARDGAGPTLLEMKTYRFAGHSRSDQALYRPQGELESWKRHDPIDLLKLKLLREELATEPELQNMRISMEHHVASIATKVLKMAKPTAGDMLLNVFAPSLA